MGMFKNTLLLAQQGNEKALEKLLNRYDPLLKKCSIIMIYTQQYKKRRESIRNQLSRELYEK